MASVGSETADSPQIPLVSPATLEIATGLDLREAGQGKLILKETAYAQYAGLHAKC